MPVRTWEPGLILAAKVFKHYMTRWNTQLSTNLTADQYTAMQNCLTCVLNLLHLLHAD